MGDDGNGKEGPVNSVSDHIPCRPPSIEKMISDTKKYYERDKQEKKMEQENF